MYRVIDTAGLRKKNKQEDSIEFYSTVRTFRVIKDADIALVLIDATKGFTNHDRNIIRYVIDQGKGMVLVINKWDAIEKDNKTVYEMTDTIHRSYPALKFYPKCFISITENKRIFSTLEKAKMVNDSFKIKLKTKVLNDFIKEVVKKKQPPYVKGKNLSIKYVAQIFKAPPIFIFLLITLIYFLYLIKDILRINSDTHLTIQVSLLKFHLEKNEESYFSFCFLNYYSI